MRDQFGLFDSWLSPLGFRSSYSEDRSVFDPEALDQTDLLMLMGLDWSEMTALESKHWPDPSQAKPYQPLSQKHRQSLLGYLAKGKPLFCHHSGLLSFDERKELQDIYDGRWIVGQSYHPESHEFEVRVASSTHPVTRGLDHFKTTDELYTNLATPRHSEVLLQAQFQGKENPQAWAGKYGSSKILCLTLGHDLKAYEPPMMRKFFTNAVQWLVQK
jgi:hypothetical protein